MGAVVRLARAYSTLEDVEYVAHTGRSFTSPDDRRFLQNSLDTIERGRIEAGELGHIRGAPSA